MSEQIRFKDLRHIVHVAIIVVVVIVGFLIARWATVPKSFGQYGHYRGASIEEDQNLPVVLQSADTCKECHNDKLERKSQPTMWLGYGDWQKGKHSAVTCENCHSKCQEHVQMRRDKTARQKDPILVNRSQQQCLMCHTALAARPKVVKPYDAETHAGYYEAMKLNKDAKCTICHIPHVPETMPEPPDEGK